MIQKTVIVDAQDRLVRVPDPIEAANSRAELSQSGSWVLGLAGFATTALVAYFYFGFGLMGSMLLALGAVLLAPTLVAFAIVMIVVVFSFLLDVIPSNISRHKKNKKVRSLKDSLLAGTNTEHIVLFLRPFNPDRGWKIGVKSFWDSRKSGVELFDEEYKRFYMDGWEDRLSSRDVQFLRVSDKIDAAGGSIRLDDEVWKDEVRGLIQAAGSIVLLPGLTEGMLWETEQIKAQEKVPVTTVIMPPGYTPDDRERALWEKLAGTYSKFGLIFPDYEKDGMLMKFNSSGTLLRSMCIVDSGYDELRRFIVASA